MLEQCCNYFKQSRNNVATLCCTKNRCNNHCCESSRATSPLVTALVECLTAEQGVAGSNPGVGPILRVLKQLEKEGSAFALQTARLLCGLHDHVKWHFFLQEET